MSDENRMEVTEALAQELGIEADEQPESSGVDDFFKDVASAAPKEDEGNEEPAAEEEAKWIHEPTGKEFDSEVEYLRYDSSYNNDKWGKRFKELEAKLDQREDSAEKPKDDETPLTKEDLKKKLWPNQKDEYREDPVADFVLEGLDNALGMALAPLQQQNQKLQETVTRLEGQLQETGLRSQFGIDAQTEQKLIEKHEWLGAINNPKSRMAAMQHLASQQTGQETGNRKLADKVPQRVAADHVENSAGGSVPENEQANMESKLFDLDDKTRLGVFGRMFENSDLGRRLSGDYDF